MHGNAIMCPCSLLSEFCAFWALDHKMLQASRTCGKKGTQRSLAPRVCLGLQTAHTSSLYMHWQVPSKDVTFWYCIGAG